MMYSSLKSAMHWSSSPKTPAVDDLCETCHIKPKYVEGGYQHPYCSRTCARYSQSHPGSPCALQGCQAQGSITRGGFCSDAHAREAVRVHQAKACVSCRVLPRIVDKLCNSCSLDKKTDSVLREVNPKGVTFHSVVAEFLRAWQGSGSPAVAKVIEISLTRDVRARFDYYRKSLESTIATREVTTYHSTQCICDLGVNDLVLCDWNSCGICNIIKSAFNHFVFGIPHNSGSCGDGVYSYRNPAQADRFATSSTSSPYRVMLACTVVLAGKPQDKMVCSDTGNIISHDGERVFVGSADAIIPSHVILYTR